MNDERAVDISGARIALYCEVFESPIRPANTIRYVFLDPRSRSFYHDWESAANDCVAVLRSVAGRNPYDRDVADLVGELSTQSEEFRTRWAAHNVRFHLNGLKRFHHPLVGDISLNFKRLDLAAAPGLTIFTAATALSSAPGQSPQKTRPYGSPTSPRSQSTPLCGRPGTAPTTPGSMRRQSTTARPDTAAA